ncbi:MAG: A24 family peptidase [Methylophilales bacterium]|nr:A24 family peptidase [Methylophilales bacterium]
MPTSFFIFIATVFGLVVGSFLNVVIHRLPKILEREWEFELASHIAEKSGAEPPPAPTPYTLSAPRSACPCCGYQISALENIPLISYVALGGKCASCKISISIRYPLVEALTGFLAAAIAWKFGFGLQAFAAFILVASLITLTFIDLDTMMLPDDITLPLLWAGLLFNLQGGFIDLQSAVIGAVVGYGLLWAAYWLFKLATGKEGMGYGDFKLLAALGAWFGWQALPPLLVISGVTGSIIGFALMTAKNNLSGKIPFGPYLALGGIVTLFFGSTISRLYL